MADFSGIWLSKPVLELSDLNLTDKVVLCQVITLSRENECNATNKYLAGQIGTTVTSISLILKKLSQKDYIHIEDGKNEGNKRQIYPSLKSLNTLFKNLKEGDAASLKIFNTLFKNFKEALIKFERPYLKILNTLFNNFKELIYRIENKRENKEESKIERVFKKVNGATALFQTILLISGGVYENEKTYKAFLKAERKKPKPPSSGPPQFPENWTPSMQSIYSERWIPFYRKKAGRNMQPDSVKLQLEKLSVLNEVQLIACIENSIANDYQGLFPDKYRTYHDNPAKNAINGNASANSNPFGQGAIIPTGSTYRQQSFGRRKTVDGHPQPAGSGTLQ
ncbi:hypothetical protein GCM10028807_54730 [Spirosoma daeguense]